jgi:hypothetical protein
MLSTSETIYHRKLIRYELYMNLLFALSIKRIEQFKCAVTVRVTITVVNSSDGVLMQFLSFSSYIRPIEYVTPIVRFEVLRAASVNITGSWNETSYRAGSVSQRQLLRPASGPNIMIHSSTLKMEAAAAFETLVPNYQSARSHISQNSNLIISIPGLVLLASAELVRN